MEQGIAQRTEQRVDELARQVGELVALCERLRVENASLKHQQKNLTSERAHLIEKNEQARARVEAMISRLKAMEAA